MLRKLRDALHPLHLLRRSKTFSDKISPSIDVTVRTRLHGVHWPIYVRLMRNLSYVVGRRLLEPGIGALVDILISYFHPRVFWDVGANVGVYSWIFLSRVPDGHVLLLEPEPDNVQLIRRTVARVGLSHATCLSVAASDSIGQSAFERDPVSGATGGLASNSQPFIARHYGLRAPTMLVQTTTLDELMLSHPPPDLVKIDVEGAELAVLRGADQMLGTVRPVLLFELSAQNRVPVLALLEANGYRVHPSSDPDAPLDEASDMVALPTPLDQSWDDLQEQWRRHLRFA